MCQTISTQNILYISQRLVSASDWYSDSLQFESQLDPEIFSMGLFLNHMQNIIIPLVVAIY